MDKTKDLIESINKCEICKPFLKDGCRPVISFSKNSKIILIGQAPGKKVHNSGIPWDDKSGENLRDWLGVTRDQFYDADIFGIIPMGFCYPGRGNSGDLPPRKECAPFWHSKILEQINRGSLYLLIGSYAQTYYLREKKLKTLTETIKNYDNFLPTYFPLPHPSPRNNIWLRRNEWFKKDILPILKIRINELL